MRGFETVSHEELIAEQAVVQSEKFQGRLLAEYSDYIFPGQDWIQPRGSAVADFVRPFIGKSERAALEGVLENLSEIKADEQVNWVDMGGGRALPMRQLGADPDVRQKLRMTNVDLFSFGLEGLKLDEVEYLENLAPGMTSSEADPTAITDNVETVILPEPADIITSVESIQYLNNPLLAISNWYNQLTDNGMLFVATEHNWADWIHYCREPGAYKSSETPTGDLFDELSKVGINYATTYDFDETSGFRSNHNPREIRTMIIQKKPGTMLKLVSPVVDILVNDHHYKDIYYEAQPDSSPIMEVVKSNSANNTLVKVALAKAT
jgi:hypothetical protein